MHQRLKITLPLSTTFRYVPDYYLSLCSSYSHILCISLQSAGLRDRDQVSHEALAGEMLHRSVVGAEPPSHPELRAFRSGFNLTCRNGFSFPEVRPNFQ